MIEDIQKKHIIHFSSYSQMKNWSSIYLLSDYVFLNSLKKISGKIDDYHITVKTILDKFFMIKITKELDKSKKPCEFLDNILGSNNTNLLEFKNITNFTNYFFEALSIKNTEYLDNFLIYNPVTDGCDLYITIQKTNDINNNLLVYVVDPIYDYEDFADSIKEQEGFKYILILYKTYKFTYKEDDVKKLAYYFNFLNQLPYQLCEISDDEPIVKEFEDIIIKKNQEKNIAYIVDKKEGRLIYKYHTKNIDKVDENSIIDKNIEVIMKSLLKFEKRKEIKLLIEEPFNLIYTYIKAKYKKWKLVLLNDKNNDNICEYISTYTKTKINNSNIYSYINSLKDERFDAIILFNNSFPDENNDIIPKTLFQDNKKIKNIKEHLNEQGKFYFNLFIKNRYIKETVENKLRVYFKKINVYNNYSDINNICICNKN